MGWKVTGVLFGIAVASVITAKAISMMVDRVEKSELAKDVATEAARSIKEQVVNEDN